VSVFSPSLPRLEILGLSCFAAETLADFFRSPFLFYDGSGVTGGPPLSFHGSLGASFPLKKRTDQFSLSFLLAEGAGAVGSLFLDLTPPRWWPSIAFLSSSVLTALLVLLLVFIRSSPGAPLERQAGLSPLRPLAPP